jgi:lipopolysaccharide export system ATP-binding protein
MMFFKKKEPAVTVTMQSGLLHSAMRIREKNQPKPKRKIPFWPKKQTHKKEGNVQIVQPEIQFRQEDLPNTRPETGHILGVKELRKRFGKREVVRGVSFLIKNGEVSGLLGPNGAGKTTIFYTIAGFLRPNSGAVILDGNDITNEPMYRRARAGITYLPQDASVFRKLTVEQNLWAILETRMNMQPEEKKDRLERLLEEFGIKRIRNQLGYTLSGGERRRTEIARALATEPKFLLLDEPFAGIDPKTIFELKAIIRTLAEKGIGVLITDHNVRDTLEITTKSFIINDGIIVAEGNKNAILDNPTVREIYLGSEFTM